MCFDYATDNLYTGQTDGKILKWEMLMKNPILILDINDSKKNYLSLPKIQAQAKSKEHIMAIPARDRESLFHIQLRYPEFTHNRNRPNSITIYAPKRCGKF